MNDPFLLRRNGPCTAATGTCWTAPLCLAFALALALALLPGVAVAQASRPAAAAASAPAVPASGCSRLSQVAQALHLAGPGTAGHYQCDLQQRTPSGQVLALRYRGPEVRDGSSNLVGYYEVDRSTQAVHPWDLATGQRSGKPLPADAMPAPTVMACGLAFELPVHYRISKPRRSEASGGMRQCAFDVVPARPEPKQLSCKDEDEGGSPPYKVCDWAVDSGGEWPTVQVARTRIATDRRSLEPFQYDNGAWRLPNAQADAEPAKRVRFFGKLAYQGEVITRMSWHRTRVKKFEYIHAGTGSTDALLVQLTPALAVVLVSPPADRPGGSVEECQVFCGSLRAAGRSVDEP